MTRSILLTICITMLAAPILADDGIPHVKNGETPSDGVLDMHLEELWRRGGEDDDVFFGVILKALADDDGNVYLLDQQLAEVQVFDPDGEHLRTLSREGDGPGEVRQPTDMIWMPDGDLGIVQSFPGSIIRLDGDGNPDGIFRTGEEGAIIAMVEARSRGGNLALGMIDIEIKQGGQDRFIFVGSYDENGEELCRYHGMEINWDFSNLVLREREQYLSFYGRWDLLHDGRVVAHTGGDDYELTIYGIDGAKQLTFGREVEPYERSTDERDLMMSILEGTRRQFGGLPMEIEVEDDELPVAQIFAHPDGDIWVLPPHGVREQPDGVLATWDVFDTRGRFIRQTRVHAPGDGRRDGLYLLGDGRALMVTGQLDAMAGSLGAQQGDDAEEVPPSEVVCFRIR